MSTRAHEILAKTLEPGYGDPVQKIDELLKWAYEQGRDIEMAEFLQTEKYAELTDAEALGYLLYTVMDSWDAITAASFAAFITIGMGFHR